MLKRIALIIYVLVSFAQAETVKGYCSVLDAPFKQPLFSVSPGTIVKCGPSHKGWCLVILEVYVEKRSVYDGSKVLANAKLKTSKGQLIGRSNIDFTPLQTLAENDTAYLLELGGFIEASCIEDTSIVEHELEKLFSRQDSLASEEQFTAHFKQFDYTKWISKGDFTSYLLPDINYNSVKPGIRTAVIFEKSKAVAVVYGRSVSIRKYEMHMQAPNYNLYILKSGNETYKKKLADSFMKELDALY